MFQFLDALRGSSAATVEGLLELLVERQCLADELIVAEGKHSADLYVVMSGIVSVFYTGGAGERRELAQLGPGALFGDIAWLEGSAATASVRALESSVIGSFNGAALHRLADERAEFGRDLYRALAWQSSERVRRLTATLQQLRVRRDLPDANADTQALVDGVGDLKSALAMADREMLENKGVLSPERMTALQALLNAALDLVQTTLASPALQATPSRRDDLVGFLQRELLPYVRLTETTERFYSKPRGYAGDFQTIRQIYANRPGGTGRLGPPIDACFLQRGPSQAVRNRRGLLAAEINAAIARQGRAHVMSLACGPAAEAFDSFAALADRSSLVFSGLDIDRQALDLPPQHLIYSIGLIDYFNDEFVVALVNWAHAKLAPGGRLILGNFHPRNADKQFMDHVLDWKLIHRSEDDMNRLFEASAFGGPCSRILYEEQRINLFAEGIRH